MPVAYLLDFPEGTLEQYDAVCAIITPDLTLPPGARYHGAGLRPSGGLRVMDIWDDDAPFQQFAEEKIVPTSARYTLSPPGIERIGLAAVRGGAPGHATFAHVVRLPGFDEQAFAAMDRAVLPDGGLPEGCLLHANGPTDDGWVAVGYWTSRAARDRFLDTQVRPATQAAGHTQAPVIEDLDLHGVMAPQAVPAGG